MEWSSCRQLQKKKKPRIHITDFDRALERTFDPFNTLTFAHDSGANGAPSVPEAQAPVLPLGAPTCLLLGDAQYDHADSGSFHPTGVCGHGSKPMVPIWNR